MVARYELDVTWIHIRLLRRLGLAKSVQVAGTDSVEQREAA